MMLTRLTFIVTITFAVIAASSSATAQIQPNHVVASGTANEIERDGVIYPQFWKAVVQSQEVFVPLSEISTFGIQDYFVEGGGRVYELSILLRSRSAVRIYFLDVDAAIDSKTNIVGKAVSTAEKHLGTSHRVTKTYPVTTHVDMMEIRVGAESDITTLRDSLQKSYLDWRLNQLAPEQRPQSVAEVQTP